MSERRVGAQRPRGFESLPACHGFRDLTRFLIFVFIKRSRIGPSGDADYRSMRQNWIRELCDREIGSFGRASFDGSTH